MGFLYNNALFTIQVVFSALVMSFSITMLYIGKDPSIYLPVLTSIIGFWLPSPAQTLKQLPAPVPQPLPESVTPVAALVPSSAVPQITEPMVIASPSAPIPILTPVGSPSVEEESSVTIKVNN